MKLRRLLKVALALVLSVLAVLVCLFMAAVVLRAIEERRIGAALPRQAPARPHARLNQQQMKADLRALASPELEGRLAGSPGGLKARAYVAQRFAELDLRPFGDSFVHPFTFTPSRKLRGGDSATPPKQAGANVLGWVPGTARPECILVLSAHYDHLGRVDGRIHPGADDNASGVAALLAIAAYVRAHPLECSVLFASFDAEESGSKGAHAFIEAPPVPRAQLRANLNLDMIGRGDARRIFIAGTAHWPRLRPVAERAARTSALAVHLGHDRSIWKTGGVHDWTRLSDHVRFHDAGIPFLYLGVEDHPDYHQPTDTLERISPEFLFGAAELALQLLLELDAWAQHAPVKQG